MSNSKCQTCGKRIMMFTLFCSPECSRIYDPQISEDTRREQKDIRDDMDYARKHNPTRR